MLEFESYVERLPQRCLGWRNPLISFIQMVQKIPPSTLWGLCWEFRNKSTVGGPQRVTGWGIIQQNICIQTSLQQSCTEVIKVSSLHMDAHGELCICVLGYWLCCVLVVFWCWELLWIAPQQNWEDISDFSYHGVRGWSGCWVGHLWDLEPDGYKCPTRMSVQALGV